jgi:signal peptidase I
LEDLLDSNYPDITPEQESNPQPRKRPAWLVFTWEVFQTLLMAVILYFLIDAVVGRVRVENISMQPTLHQDQFILVNKMAYRLGDFHRGDIIVFHFPGDPREDYIKRVIGLPGDNVEIRDGRVFVNDMELEENYIAAPPNYTKSYQVPEEGIFVLGDNRNQSSDSHSWGYVPTSNVVGKALIVYWPLEELKILNEVPKVSAASNKNSE